MQPFKELSRAPTTNSRANVDVDAARGADGGFENKADIKSADSCFQSLTRMLVYTYFITCTCMGDMVGEIVTHLNDTNQHIVTKGPDSAFCKGMIH